MGKKCLVPIIFSCLSLSERPYIETADPVVVVTTGDSAKLMCRARGIPTPRIAWTYKGQPFSTNIT